jgi:DNA-binding CsgD family transcriptional regulator
VYEFRRPDFNLFEELRSRRSPVAAISTATRGRLNASARFREMIAPSGAADELRVSFTDPFGVWAALVIFTDRTLNEDDLEFVSGLVPPITGALRAAAAAAVRPFSAPYAQSTTAVHYDHDGPSVLVLDQDDRIVSADSAARRRLAMLPEPRPVELPGLISFVSAQARWGPDGRTSTARMRTTDGRWFLVSASVLGDAPTGDVAVVMQPAPSAAVLDNILRALGLTAREREVAALAQRGHSAKGIASTLMISPWTVQDHLKAIYEKTGVGSRAELVSLAPAG